MWHLWILALCSPLPALHGVDQGSKGASKGSTQRAQDSFPGISQTSLEKGTGRMGDQSSPWSGKWWPSTTPPHTPVQSSTDYTAREVMAPTITVLVENGTCNIVLSCSVAEGAEGEVAFSWQLANASEVLSSGPTLRITQRPQQGALDYVCTVHSKGAHGSSQVSLREHCQEDPPTMGKKISASFYAKYMVPILVVLVVLAVLFLMYRRKRGREIHSSTVYINESSVSDSDPKACSTADQTAEASFLPQAFRPFSPEENVDIPQVTATIAHPDTPESLKRPPSRA